MNTVIIHSKAYNYISSEWVVSCTINTENGTREGTEVVAGLDTMNDAEIQTALIAKYL